MKSSLYILGIFLSAWPQFTQQQTCMEMLPHACPKIILHNSTTITIANTSPGILTETENGYTCTAVLPKTTGLIGLLELKLAGPDGELKTTNNLPYTVNVTCNEALGYYTLVNEPTEPIFHLWCLSLTGSPGPISTIFKNYMKTYY